MTETIIYKNGNAIRIRNFDGPIRQKLAATLSYSRRTAMVTQQDINRAGGKKVLITNVICYHEINANGETQIVTNAGFLDRVTRSLREIDVDVKLVDKTPTDRAHAYEPCWAVLADYDLRYRQEDVLRAIAANNCGRVWWATGTGKSFLIPLVCRLFPKARIVVTTRFQQVLEDRHEQLAAEFGDVGIFSSRKHKQGGRITCFSAGSLHHADPARCDMLLADEYHELGTDKTFAAFAKFRTARMFGFSANNEDRFDGADFELEGIFGPVIATLKYDDAVTQGMIVPIRVQWQSVSGRNPSCGYDGVAMQRHGIWRNKLRNKKIAEVARSFPNDQVLVTVKTLEHACHLKKELPEYTLCYSPDGSNEDSIEHHVALGTIPEAEKKMTIARLQRLKRGFERGKLRKVIATSVWNRGVNFRDLSVLIRADGSSSPIDDTQIPGRLSRTTEDGSKSFGILIDFLDQFDPRFARRAKRRMKHYAEKDWKQAIPTGS